MLSENKICISASKITYLNLIEEEDGHDDYKGRRQLTILHSKMNKK